MKALRYAMLALIVMGLAAMTAPAGVWAGVNGSAQAVTGQAAPPGAPASAVTLIADAGYNGYIKAGSWIPVRLTLTASESLDGEIVLSTQPDRSRRYGLPVTLARGARKTLTLYAPPTTNPIEALFVQKNVVAAVINAPVHLLADEDRMILVVSEPADGLNFLSDLRTPFGGKSYVSQLLPEQIPDHTAALDSIDVLVLNNVDTLALSENQRNAVRAWVLGGGHLIIDGGPGARLTVGGFEDIAPARVGATLQNSSVSNLRALLAPNTVEAPANLSATTTLTPATSRAISSTTAVSTTAAATNLLAPVAMLQAASPDARSLVNSNDTPLIIRREMGRGVVDQLAFDPTLAPVRDWPDRRLLYASLLGGHLGLNTAIGPLRADLSAVNAARALPGAALPPFLVIAGFLLCYVLIIGPINFFFLRKLNRLAWAWITIPGAVVLFALIGTATGFRLRGNEPQMHRLSIITGDAQISSARAQSIVGVFSPRRTSVDVSTGRALAEEVLPDPNVQDRLSFELSEPNRMQKVVATNNDVRAFYLRGESQLPPIQADLEFIPGRTISEAARVAGEIRNESNASLIDCVLIAGKDYRAMGDIAPNEHVRAEVRLLLNRPQMLLDMPMSRVSPSGYVSSLGTTFGRSGTSSMPLTSFRAPFDMDGSSLAEITLNWRDFKDDRLSEQAQRGLLTAIYTNPDVSAGNGVSLACWENADRIGAAVQDASYTDQGLRIWRLPVKPYLATRGALLPPDMFSWNVLSSSSLVSLDQNGLSLDPGDHIIGLTPWVSTRASSQAGAEITLTLGTSIDSALSALRSSSVSVYDWGTQQFTRVITGLNTSPSEIPLSGAYLSPAGEMRLRVEVREDHINLTNIQTLVRIR